MTLEDKILLVDRMISQDPETTIKDYIERERRWRPAPVELSMTKQSPVVHKTIFQTYNHSFMFGYLGLIRKVAEKYKPMEDQIMSRPPARYSNRTPFHIASELEYSIENLYDS